MVQHPNPASEDNGIAALLRRLRTDALELLRAELALARAELVMAVHKLLAGATLGVIGAVLMLAGLFALVAAGIIALSAWLPLWLAAGSVGIALLLIGLLLFNAGRHKLDAQSLALSHSRHSVQRDLGLLNRKDHEPASPRSEYPDPLRARAAHSPAAGSH